MSSFAYGDTTGQQGKLNGYIQDVLRNSKYTYTNEA